MLKNLLLGVIGAAVATSVLATAATAAGVSPNDQSNSKTVTITAGKTSPTSGKQMFTSYCASCHGVNAKGDGPMAAALKTQPANLTLLSKNNGGAFPANHVATVLRFGSPVQSHGTVDMPVWGPALGNMNEVTPLERQLRISNLSRYLESIQAK
jgi:mono/diheme cytochrome c family protein